MSNTTALQVILFVYTDSSCFCIGVGKSRTLRDSKLAADATAYNGKLDPSMKIVHGMAWRFLRRIGHV
jgi:hypothetical protein